MSTAIYILALGRFPCAKEIPMAADAGYAGLCKEDTHGALATHSALGPMGRS